MREMLSVMTAVTLAFACQRAPEDMREAALAQAALAVDSAQAALWQQAEATGAGIADLHADSAVVTRRRTAPVPDRPAPQTRQPFPQSVDAAVVVLDAPDLVEPFSGTVQVESVNGEFLVLNLGDQRTLSLQAKVGGRSLRAQQGESGSLYLRRGDPFERDDIVALRLEQDDLIHALVGGDEPVRFTVPNQAFQAAQIGRPDSNVMSVSVTVAGESRTLDPGGQAAFGSGLTVKLLSSVAVQGAAADALPGRPYRVELLAWRTE